MTKLPRRLISVSILAALALEANPAAAQLEEVIVTARKREESIMNVPVVATTLSGEQLEQYAIDDMRTIADYVPGLNMGSNTLTIGTQVTLRGVGTSTLNPAIDQSVALNVDGMQMTQGWAYQLALFDMARIEVLKGPQSLFYGKASPAGVIAVRTADPTDDFDFSVMAGYEFEAEEIMTDLILSGPLTDTLGARLAVRYSDSEGYFHNDSTPESDPFAAALGDPAFGARDPDGRNYDEMEYLLLRGTLTWKPTDRFDARFKLNYASHETPYNGGSPQLSSCPDGTAGLVLDFLGEDCSADERVDILSMNPDFFVNIKNNGQPFSEADQYFTTLEWNYLLTDDLTLTSVTGYYDIDVESMINATSTAQFGPVFTSNNELQRKDFTQEFRLTSDYEGSLNFMLGAFYHDGTADLFTNLAFNQVISPLLPPDLSDLISFGIVDHTIDTEAVSLFGQVLWDITPVLELGVGARWTDEERSHKVIDTTNAHVGVPPFSVPLARPDIDSSNLSPEITLTYTPQDNLTLFASYKEATKSGSFDGGGAPAPGTDTSFDEEDVSGFEAGLKSRLMDERLAFNIAGYFYDYDDLQVERSIFDAATGSFLTRTVNAGSSEVYGIDFDLAYAPAAVEGLTLFVAGNWNKAEFTDFKDADCWGGQRIQDGCNLAFEPEAAVFTAQDLSGEPLLRAPEWTFNYGFDYERPVWNDKALVFGVNANYSSKYLMNPLAREDMYQDSYTKVNASVTLFGADEAWQVALIGENLTDEMVSGNCGLTDFANAGFLGDMVTGADYRGASGVEELACNVERGRAVWLRLTLRPAQLLGN